MDFGAAFHFISDGFFGHLSYLLLIVSMMMRRMMMLRLFVLASAIAGIIFDFFFLSNYVGVFWQALLVAVNLFQIVMLWLRDHRARFRDEEQALINRFIHGGTPGSRRMLLDFGHWADLDPGEVLTVEGARPRHLTYLAAGEVAIRHGARDIAHMGAGHFIGEMSLMGEGKASADVVVSQPARVWQIERGKLDRMKVNQPHLFALIEGAISLGLREKLIDGNRRKTGQGVTAG
ncbi:cyclic nucleotide-binding domain-containing protein [uncultured Maritimibacter sp.]|uniref:cyclic nucleotide-binding domain-containing protein n=1 Tax=uncultured Maritimibacter sp. TaxID=991866 RepID=UPI002605BBEF|nr:cyclic nucleotide-binding domain-containing protein [uncultured Maritimibacter sp.]